MSIALAETRQTAAEAATVSIVTVAFNSEKTIARTIESVLAQTFPCTEYFIMDGASTDGTVAIAHRYDAAFAEKGIDFRVYSEPDVGMYDALNKVIALCSGTIIGSVNSDDYYEPIAVETVLAEYEKEPYDMIYGDLRMVRKKGSFIKHAKLSPYLTTRYWNHPTTFITRETYAKEKYRCQAQTDDGDLMLRLRRGGYRVRIVHKILSNFTFGDGGMSTTKSFHDSMARARMKWQMYRQNGCGLPYLLESYATEIVKYIIA